MDATTRSSREVRPREREEEKWWPREEGEGEWRPREEGEGEGVGRLGLGVWGRMGLRPMAPPPS